MSETTLAGAPFEVRDLDTEWLLEAVAESALQSRIADRRALRLAAQWCVVHEAGPDEATVGWGDAEPTSGGDGALDGPELLGGEGTPPVAAFSPEPFAAALGVSTGSAMNLLADALDLVHRLPLINARVEALEVPVWKARKVAAWTRKLSREAAAWIDAELAGLLDKRGLRTIERVVAAAIARFHPDLVAAREEEGRRGWHVTVRHPGPLDANGTSWLDASGDSVDLGRFSELVGMVADRLGGYGDSGTLGQRRARALGLLGDLGEGASLEELLADVEARAGEAHASGTTRRRGRGRPRNAVVHVHVGLADLLARDVAPSDAVAEVERLGPATLAKVAEWLEGAAVRLLPVLDPSDSSFAVDAHDPPARMAELVRLRDRACVHPWCEVDSRDCDLDHIERYDPEGPPAQTSPDNLAPLCRRHHRCKTSGRWRYRRLRDGSYLWTGPHLRSYLVTRSGTVEITGS